MVVSNDVQVGFGRPLYHPDLVTRVLYDDELVLVVSSEHRYAKRGEVTVPELADESLILFDRDSGYYGMILNLYREHGVVPHQQMHMDNIEATKKMVEANLGIALLPAVSVEREIKLGTLHKVKLSAARPIKQEIALLYRRNKPQSGAMAGLLELLGEMYEVDLRPNEV
jgi:DNA-binding transcriptional LysR family regulator